MGVRADPQTIGIQRLASYHRTPPPECVSRYRLKCSLRVWHGGVCLAQALFACMAARAHFALALFFLRALWLSSDHASGAGRGSEAAALRPRRLVVRVILGAEGPGLGSYPQPLGVLFQHRVQGCPLCAAFD